MLPLTYGYLVGDLVFLAVWCVFYAFVPRIRREMIVMGIFIGCVSVLTAYFWWTYDWWHPLTITGTRIGIEDFLTGFASGGVMVSVHEVLTRTKYRAREPHSRFFGVPVLVLLTVLMFGLLHMTHLTSFWSSVIAMLITTLVLFGIRRDLMGQAFVSGIGTVGVSLLFYYVILILFPTWVETTYDFKHLSGVLIAGIPIEELVFWFLAGMLFSTFSKYRRKMYAVSRQ